MRAINRPKYCGCGVNNRKLYEVIKLFLILFWQLNDYASCASGGIIVLLRLVRIAQAAFIAGKVHISQFI
jgi:hypothetical protein